MNKSGIKKRFCRVQQAVCYCCLESVRTHSGKEVEWQLLQFWCWWQGELMRGNQYRHQRETITLILFLSHTQATFLYFPFFVGWLISEVNLSHLFSATSLFVCVCLCVCLFSHIGVANDHIPQMHSFGLWEEARVANENPLRHRQREYAKGAQKSRWHPGDRG